MRQISMIINGQDLMALPSDTPPQLRTQMDKARAGQYMCVTPEDVKNARSHMPGMAGMAGNCKVLEQRTEGNETIAKTSCTMPGGIHTTGTTRRIVEGKNLIRYVTEMQGGAGTTHMEYEMRFMGPTCRKDAAGNALPP